MKNYGSLLKNFFKAIWNMFLLILSAFRMFTSPKEILEERIAKDRRLKRYRETDLETLYRKKRTLLRQAADLWTPGEIPELQLADIKQVIKEKEAQILATKKEEERLKSEKLARRECELREHLGGTNSVSI